MQRIHLRDYYPDYYKSDYMVEVPDEVADAMRQAERDERAYRRRVYYHRAQYSLDLADGIENNAVFRVESPSKLYEHKLTIEQLYVAIATLPPTQSRRVCAYFFLGLAVDEIAQQGNVEKMSVSESINRGLHNIKLYLQRHL